MTSIISDYKVIIIKKKRKKEFRVMGPPKVWSLSCWSLRLKAPGAFQGQASQCLSSWPWSVGPLWPH